jgi:RNA recognition motif-containing protein
MTLYLALCPKVSRDTEKAGGLKKTKKEIKMKKMYVGNIPYDATEEDLRQFFSEQGEIESLKIIQDQFTDRSKGFGFIEMVNEEDAKKAIATLNGKDFKGKSLTVAEAKPQQKRQGDKRGSGYGGGAGRGWR